MGEYDFQREVLSALGDIRERTARLEAGQESWMEARDREIKEIKCDVTDHEKRIRPLESQHSKVLGVAAGSGIAASILIKLATWIWGAR